MEDWRKRFNVRILERGEDYYRKRRVFDLQKDGTCYTAKVRGSYVYRVEADILDGRVRYMNCNCPHFDDGNNCKHLAALLMTIENDGMEPDIEEPDPVDELDDAEIRSFLKSLAADDMEVRKRLQVKVMIKKTNDDTIGEMKKEAVKKIMPSLRYYSSNFERVLEVQRNTLEMYEELVVPLIDSQKYMYAYEIMSAMFAYVHQPGESRTFRNCREADQRFGTELNRILAICTEEEKQVILSALFQLLRECEGYYYPPLFDTLLVNRREDKEGMTELAYLISDVCLKYPGDMTSRNYITDLLVSEKLPEKVYEDLLYRHDELPDVKRMLAEYLIAKDDKQTARNYLVDMLAAAGTKQESASILRMMLKTCGEDEVWERNHTIRQILFDCEERDPELMRSLKEHSTDAEWAEIRARAEKEWGFFDKMSLYLLEENYGQILESCRSSLTLLNQYSDALIKNCREEFIQVYMAALQNTVRTANNRSIYNELIQGLSFLKEATGDEGLSRSLANMWKNRYPTRAALMRMLKEEGY